MNVWVLLIAIFLLIIPGLALVLIGGIEKFGNKKKNEIYIVLFIAGWIFLFFGIIMLIYAYISSRKKIDSEASYYTNMQMQYMNYMNYLSNQNRMMQAILSQQSANMQDMQRKINTMTNTMQTTSYVNDFSPNPSPSMQSIDFSTINSSLQNMSSMKPVYSPAVPMPTSDIYG